MESMKNRNEDWIDKNMIWISLVMSAILIATGVIHGFFEFFVVAVLGYLAETTYKQYRR